MGWRWRIVVVPAMVMAVACLVAGCASTEVSDDPRSSEGFTRGDLTSLMTADVILRVESLALGAVETEVSDFASYAHAELRGTEVLYHRSSLQEEVRASDFDRVEVPLLHGHASSTEALQPGSEALLLLSYRGKGAEDVDHGRRREGLAWSLRTALQIEGPEIIVPNDDLSTEELDEVHRAYEGATRSRITKTDLIIEWVRELNDHHDGVGPDPLTSSDSVTTVAQGGLEPDPSSIDPAFDVEDLDGPGDRFTYFVVIDSSRLSNFSGLVQVSSDRGVIVRYMQEIEVVKRDVVALEGEEWVVSLVSGPSETSVQQIAVLDPESWRRGAGVVIEVSGPSSAPEVALRDLTADDLRAHR